MGTLLIKFFRYPPINSITFAAFIMAIAGIMSRILGFVRDRLLASAFGAGDVLDVYYAAFRIPDFIFDLLIVGALSSAFVPVFTSLITRKKIKDAWRLASGVFMMLAGALIVIVLVLYVLAPHIITLLVPGFDSEKINMTITFTRIMLLSPLFLGMSALFGGILMSLKRFVIYSLAPIFYNIGIICGIIFFVPHFGPVGLAWGVVFGAFLHFVSTMPAAILCGLGHYFIGVRRAWRNIHVRRVLKLMVPRVFGAASVQISMIAVTFFASLTAAGTLAAFTFANNISSIPIGVIGVPFAVAAFPTLSAYFAQKDYDKFTALIIKYIRRTIFLIVPFVVVLITLRAQIVRVVFGTGAFDWHDTIMTFQILGILSCAIFSLSLIPLLARAFYAMHNTVVPVVVGFISVAVTIVTIVFLLPRCDVYAIPIGFVIGSLTNFVLLFILLEKALAHKTLTKVHNAVLGALGAMACATAATYVLAHFESIALDNMTALVFIGLVATWLSVFLFCTTLLRVDVFYVRIIAMAMLSATAAQVIKYIIGTVTDLSTFGEVFVQLVFAGGVSIGVYLFLGYVLHIDEFFVLRARVIKFILRRNLQEEK